MYLVDDPVRSVTGGPGPLRGVSAQAVFDLGQIALSLHGHDDTRLRRVVHLFERALASDRTVLVDDRLVVEWREQLIRARATIMQHQQRTRPYDH